jgi:hypothetical protein
MKPRTGFVIECNVRHIDGRILPNNVLTSDYFGAQEFDDLTAGTSQVLIDKDIEGDGVIYDVIFVVIP